MLDSNLHSGIFQQQFLKFDQRIVHFDQLDKKFKIII